MTVSPQSLFARTVLLIALLIIVSHVIWLQVFQHLARPTPHHIAAHLAGSIQPLRETLAKLSPEQQEAHLRTLNEHEHLRLFKDSDEHSHQVMLSSAVAESITPLIRPLLGSDTYVRAAHQGQHGRTVWWVEFSVGKQRYWARVPRNHIEQPLPWSWLGWTALGIGLSIVGATIILWHVNRPLRALSEATRLVGQGMTPPTIPELGPSEIRRLSHAFNQMILDLQRMTADRELLMAGISHDLRTPLARMRLAAELMAPDNEGILQAGMVQDINDMETIIDQFLAYVREGQTATSATETDINELVQSVCARFQNIGHNLSLVQHSVPGVMVQPASIRRLISNLIDNAIKHAGTEVEVLTQLHDGNVSISVLDRGPGIAEEELIRMKLPFTRHEPARGGTSGSGLGLAIVERIARNNGAKFQLDPRSGGGLAATLILPVR